MTRRPDLDAAVAAALTVAFPLMLRDFLYSDDARDVTGKWGFTTTLGDEFRAELLALVASDEEGS